MNEIPYRLKQLRLKFNIKTQKQLAEKLGVGSTIIAEMEQGIRPVGDKAKLALLKVFKYDIENDKYFDDVDNINLENKNIVKIPFYHTSIAAGTGIYIEDDVIQDELIFDIRDLKQALPTIDYKNLIAFKVSGDSMVSPDNTGIFDGDILLVDITKKEVYEGIYVFKAQNELKVKKLIKHPDNTITIQSFNPRYNTYFYNPEEATYTIEIIGKVVLNRSRGGSMDKF